MTQKIERKCTKCKNFKVTVPLIGSKGRTATIKELQDKVIDYSKATGICKEPLGLLQNVLKGKSVEMEGKHANFNWNLYGKLCFKYDEY